jgi:hypothetical protein
VFASLRAEAKVLAKYRSGLFNLGNADVQQLNSNRKNFVAAAKQASIYSLQSVLIAVLTISMIQPGWTAGANTSLPNTLATASPAGPQVVPSAWTTSTPLPYPNTSLPPVGCSQAYTNTLNALNQSSLDNSVKATTAGGVGAIANGVQIAADAVVAAVQLAGQTDLAVGLAGTVAYGVAPAPTAAGIPFSVDAAVAAGVSAGDWAGWGISLIAGATGAASSVTGFAFQKTADGINQQIQNLNVYTADLPQCDQTFSGTVTVQKGGVNVTGNSLIQGDLGVTGNVSASQLLATQGISAFGGAITIGDPGLTTYSSGITLGGGALSGAGTGGLQAFTGDVTAIAIGNNASAASFGSVALGLNSSAAGASAVAIGNGSQALADQTVAIGFGALVSAAAGAGSFAGGTSTVLSGIGAVSIGNLNVAAGNGAVAIGDPNIAIGTGAVAVGADNVAFGQGAVALGNQNFASGFGAIAQGNGSTAGSDGSIGLGLTAFAFNTNAISIGTASVATGVNSTAVGAGANATGTSSAAFGNGATAAATNSTAVGAGATVAAGNTNSTAIGQGATTTKSNQVVLGTTSETYTAPGMNSSLSRSRQSGPLGVVTSDGAGNLASDNGALYKELTGIKAGAAIAMALSDPTLSGHESAGVKMNVSTFDGANALGFSAAGVVARNMFDSKNQLTVSGAVGVGQASTFGYQRTMTGARGSAQFTW